MSIRTLITLVSCSFLFSMTVWGQQEPCGYDLVKNQLIAQDPAYQNELALYLEETLPRFAQTAQPRSVVTIPVVVHVIHSGQSIGMGANLAFDRITSQIDILNEDYRRANGDSDNTPPDFLDLAADTEIQFCLAIKDPDGGVTNGVTRDVYSNVPDIDYIENTIKPQTTWDPDRYLNIWTIHMPSNSVIGYSYLPTQTMVGSNKDGVVIDYPKFGFVDAGNKGRTCVHEVGHYLGLQHLWGENDSNGDPIGCGSDDGVNDTPNSNGPHYGCPSSGVATCGTMDMYSNYMEYVNDDCMNLFTQGQKNVMQATLNGIRSQLTNSSSTVCEVVDFGCVDISSNPILMGFEANESTSGWIVENTNNDTRTWSITQTSTNDWGPNSGDGLAVYLWNTNGTTPADDYLFSPCFEVKKDHRYKISFSCAAAASGGTTFSEQLEMGISELQSSEDFEVPDDNWAIGQIDNTYPGYIEKTLFYEAQSNEFLSIGFHVISGADRYALQIDDILIEDLGEITSSVEVEANHHIQITPNPNTGSFWLNMGFERTEGLVNIRIFDILGRELYFNEIENIRSHQEQIDLSFAEDGIYFVRIEMENELITQKMIIDR